MKNQELLKSYIAEIESYIPQHEFTNTKISKASIGWQLDHSLKVINNVTKAVAASNPADYKNNFSFLGKVFLTLGSFPRGKAKAPKHVKPPEVITKEDIMAQVTLAKKQIETIQNRDKNAHFPHPMFGHVNTKRVPRFLEIHTKHHLKIVRDMLKK